MRSFILLVTFFSFALVKPLQASQTNIRVVELFTLVDTYDPVVSGQDTSFKQLDLDQKFQQGMRDLLVRLTGDSSIVSSAEAQRFINQPKSWLSTYRFEPRKEDGVTIGQNLVLVFDSERLLRDFQSAEIQVWPSSERPKTLLMGSFLTSGSLINLNSENLGYRADINLRGYPSRLALPYVLAESSESWVYPEGVSQLQSESNKIRALLLETEQDYLLSFKIEQKPGQSARLHWNLLNREGRLVSSDSREGGSPQVLMQEMFNRVIATYSYSYRQDSSVLNTAVLSIDGLMSAQQVIEIEEFLNSKKPLVHAVSLQNLSEEKVTFKVLYQGLYTNFLNFVTTIESSVLTSQDDFTGQINLRLRGLGKIPEIQLIDLSSEFVTHAH